MFKKENKRENLDAIEIFESGKTAKLSVSPPDKNGERIVLKASGTEPFWDLEITEDMIRIKEITICSGATVNRFSLALDNIPFPSYQLKLAIRPVLFTCLIQHYSLVPMW